MLSLEEYTKGKQNYEDSQSKRVCFYYYYSFRTMFLFGFCFLTENIYNNKIGSENNLDYLNYMIIMNL